MRVSISMHCFTGFSELTTFHNHICKLYESSKRLLQNDPWSTFVPTQFVNLLLVHLLKQLSAKKQLNLVANFMRNNISSSKLNQSYTTSNVEDIFKKTDGDNAEGKLILIEGAPGIGKTILCKEIAYRWACKMLLQSDHFLLLVFLRDPNVRCINSIEALVRYMYRTQSDTEIMKISKACATHLIDTEGKNVTIILDGFDELSHLKGENDFILELLYKNILPLCRIVVSSRPIASKDLQKLADVKVEILGFSEESRQAFISNELKDNHDKLVKLQSYLKENSNIDHLCYIPFMLSILVSIVKECEELPKSQTELYTKFIINAISQFLQRLHHTEYFIPNLNELPLKLKAYFLEMCKYAYHGLEHDEIVFTAKEIRIGFPTFADAPGNWSGLGLLKSAEYFSAEENSNCTSYNFLHLSIQEYLAAYYINTLETNQQINIIKKCFFTDKYLNMWIMYCGLSERPVALEHFLSNRTLLVFTKWFSIDEISKDIMYCKIKQFYLFQCLSETKNNRLHNLVSSLFHKGILDISNYTLLPKDVDTLMHILDRSNTTHWDELNLSNSSIGNFGCHQLCKALNDFNRTITFKNINLHNNQLTSGSIEAIVDIVICCETQVLYLSDYFNIDSNANIAHFASEYAFKDKLQKHAFTIHIYDEESVVFNKLSKQIIIAHLKKNYWIKSMHFINCIIDDEIVTTVTNILTTHKLCQVCLWNSPISTNTMYHLLLHMPKEKEDQLFFVYGNSLSDNRDSSFVNFIAAEYSSVTFIFINNFSMIFHGVNDIHDKFISVSKSLFCLKSEKLAELQISNCKISKHTIGLILQLIGYSRVISKCLLLNNMFSIMLLWKIIDSVNVLPSLSEMVIKHNMTNEDCCIMAHDLSKDHSHAVMILCNNTLRAYRCHNKQINDTDKVVSTIMQLYKEEENIIVYEKNVCVDNTIQIHDACISLSTNYIFLCKSFLSVTNVKKFYIVLKFLNSILQANDIAEVFFSECSFNYEFAKIFTQIFSHCKLLTKFTYINSNLDFSVVKLLINNLKAVSLSRTMEIFIHTKNISKLDILRIADNVEQLQNVAVLMMNHYYIFGYQCDNRLLKHAININLKASYVKLVNCNVEQITFLLTNRKLSFKAIECIINIKGGDAIQYIKLSDPSTSNYTVSEVMYQNANQSRLDDNQNKSKKLALKLTCIISNNKLMENLILICNNLNDDGVIMISQSLCKHSNLRIINLQSNNITDEAAEALASVISSNTGLEELHLGNNQLQLGVVKIANALKNISSIRVLDFMNNNLSEQIADDLAAAIRANNRLEILWLSGNHLGSSTVVVVNALEGISSLKDLALNDNKNRNEELAPALTSVLTKNELMQRILLSDNGLNDDGFIKIAQSLCKHSNLRAINFRSNNITEKSAEALASVISSNNKLQELYLGNNQLRLGVSKVATALKNISFVRLMDFENNHFSEQAADYLAAAIRNNNRLQKLWLSDNHLGSSTVVVVNALKGISTLKDLALNNNRNRSKELATALTSVIRTNKSMEKLSLSDSGLNDDGVKKIAQSLYKHCNLKTIDFRSNNITEKSAEALASVISSNNKMEELHLGNNQLRLGIFKVANVLKNISFVRLMDFENNQFSEAAADYLAVAIRNNNRLQKLWLSDNHLGSSTVVVVNALKGISTLEHLALNNNRNRSDELAPALASVIKTNASMETLLLSYNGLNDDGVIKIAQSLCELSNLRIINLQSNNITDKTAEALASVISSNNRLEQLYLGNNHLQLGVLKVTTALQNVFSIRVLDFMYNNLPEKTAYYLAAAICAKNRLEKLWLSGNQLGSSSVVVVNALEGISTLKDLALNDNKNRSEELVPALTSVIAKNELMERLLLSDNGLNDNGVTQIVRSLYKHSKLKAINLQSNNISDKTAEALASVISSNTGLEELYLGNNQLQLGVAKIANALKNISSIRVLDFINNNLSEQIADDLAAAIRANNRIEILWLSDNHLGSSTVVVVNALEGISSLKDLALNNNKNKSEELATALASVIAKNELMERLSVSDNGLNNDGVIQIAKSLRKHSKLKLLDMRNNGITDKAANALASVISSNTRLEALYLGNNQLRLGFIKITNALKNISSIRVLDFVNNNLSEQIADDLAAAIWANNRLEILWLSGNHLGSSTVVVVNALEGVSSLKDLALNNNKNKSEELATALASVIAKNELMERLSVSDNGLNNDGVIQIAKSLRKHSKLKLLDMRNNGITDKAADALASVISSNTRLEALYLGNNQLQLEFIKITNALKNISSIRVLDFINNNLSEQIADDLAAAIRANNRLEILWLSGNHLGSSTVVVVNALEGISSLKDLALNNNKNKSEELATALASVIAKNELMERLSVSDNGLNNDGVIQIAKSLCKHSKLKLLDMRNNGITDKAANALASVISSNTRLEALYLGNNQLQLGFIKITNALKNISSIRVLDFVNNNLSEQIADDLAAAIWANNRLEILWLSGNHLGSSTVVVVNALEGISSLKDLALNNNKNKSEELAPTLASVIAKNELMERLSVSDNGLNDDGVIQIAQSLCKHSKLKFLDMRNNGITDKAADALASVISSNTGLEVLYFGNNQLQSGVIKIAAALKDISSLIMLDLQNNNIPEEVADEISAAIKANTLLEKLWLNDNNLGLSIPSIANACCYISNFKELYVRNTGISVELIKDLTTVVDCNTLLVLSLSCNDLQSSGFMVIAQSLKAKSSLNQLCARNINVTSTVSSEISAIIDQSLSMQEILLGDNLLETGMIQIAESCSRLTKLKVLEFTHNHVCPARVVYLASIINKCSSLELLSLGGICMSVNESIYINVFRIHNKLFCKDIDKICNLPNEGKLVNNEFLMCSEILRAEMCQTLLLSYDCLLNWIYLYCNISIGYQHRDKFNQITDHENSTKFELIAKVAKENLSHIDSKAMMTSLQISRTLKVINLEDNNINEDAATELAGHLHCNNILEQLWLRGNELYDKGASVILQSLHNLSTLLILDFSYNNLSSGSADGIAVVIDNNCSLQQLWLDGNNLLTRGVVVIANALKKLTSLRILSLCSNGITDDAATEISDVITSNALLVDLMLGNNQLQTTGVRKIAVALREALMLRKLDLFNNQITLEVSEELAVTLSNCTNLQQLFLSDNMLGTEGTITIVNALQHINCLQVLTFSNNNITESAASAFMNIIKNNSSLKILLIGRNGLQTSGISLIVQTAKNITTLQLLDVSDNNVSEEEKEKFKTFFVNDNFTIIV